MYIIKGHHREESGLLTVGTLLVDKLPDGSFVTADSGHRLQASKFKVAPGIEDVEITSPDSTLEFLPAAGQIERIGMALT